MRYPCKSPYLAYKRISKEEWTVTNLLLGGTYRISRQQYSFLQRLDGKHDPCTLMPGRSRSFTRNILSTLRDCDMLAPKKKILTIGLGSCIFPLFYCFPGRLQKMLAGFWNSLLMILFIPIFLWGISIRLSESVPFTVPDQGDFFTGMCLGAASGLLLHELSHAYACLAYKGHLFEVGFGFHFFFPMAYVFMDSSNIRSPYKQFQIDAAGIEMNLLLFGVFMILARFGFGNPFVLFLSALVNLATAIFNVLPFEGTDGIHLLSRLTGREDILKSAKTMIRYRKGILFGTSAPVRCVKLAGAYLLVGFQFLMPLLLVMDLYCLLSIILL